MKYNELEINLKNNIIFFLLVVWSLEMRLVFGYYKLILFNFYEFFRDSILIKMNLVYYYYLKVKVILEYILLIVFLMFLIIGILVFNIF